MKILIIGANGKIGRRLTERLANSGHAVRAMIRKKEQRDALEKLGAEVVIGDLEGEFAHALESCDALVFTAGSGGETGADKTILVDLWGAIKTIEACSKRRIKRFIMISSRNAGDPENSKPAILHYNVAKHIADDYLINSMLDYTILRPGRLTDEPGTGRIRTSRPSVEEQSISRDDVAAVAQYCLEHDDTIGKIIELYQGDETIADVLGESD